MAEIIKMPKMSDTMTEGTIAAWLKKVGDQVKSGDILAEVETDKATMELENYEDGTLLYIGPKAGEAVAVDGVLAIVGKAGEDISALLNGQSVQLAPGARIRGQNNMMVMSGQAIGQKLVVNYTADTYGLLMDVWVLRPDELERRWPKTLEDAAKWRFDPQTQTWTKP